MLPIEQALPVRLVGDVARDHVEPDRRSTEQGARQRRRDRVRDARRVVFPVRSHVERQDCSRRATLPEMGQCLGR